MASHKSVNVFERTSAKLRRSCWTKAGLVALVLFTIIYFIGEARQLSALAEMKRSRRIIDGSPYLIDTPACRIPNLQAKSPEAMEFMEDFGPIDCGKPPLVESNDTHLEIMYSVLPEYGITDPATMSCCYRPMWRNVPNININARDANASWLYDNFVYDNDIRYANNCVPFQEPVEVTHEFVRVECQANGTEIYKDYHGFIPEPKPVPSHVNKTASSDQVNVVIIGIDSLSRLNMIRKMPKTYEYLNNTLKAFPMYGYNKVGLNTFPNLVPLLSGYSVEQLQFCWANYSAKFDLCPFIWKAFNYRGYATSFIEDTAWMGLFLYLKSGFVQQPTQYDARPIMYSGEKEAGHNKGLNANYCVGPRFQIQMVVEYTLKLMRRLRHFRQRHFTLSWGTSFSHDYINEPQMADTYYYNLLKHSYEEGLLNDTILIFMSDHGLRFGSFLNTEQGQLEALLPSLHFVIPEWFQQRYPKAMTNLEVNQERLTTVYDIHQTLNDLMDLRSVDPEYLETREKILMTANVDDLRGISLFLPLPQDRDCAEAGVPVEFCACRNLEKMDVKSPILEKIVLFAIGEINAKLHGHPACVPLVYKELKSALKGEPTQKVHRKNGAVQYQVSFYTEPGEGLFSASLLHNPEHESLEIIGDISRLNIYGNQSHCVPDFKLRPFCFCVSQDVR